MKILPFKIPKTSLESFRLQEDCESHFYDHLHQHPEIQLTLILKGEGKVIVGDYIGSFKPGDIFLIGPNLPHVFRNDDCYYKENVAGSAHSISVFFEWQSFGEKFLSLPETKSLQHFAKLLDGGLSIAEPSRSRVAQLIKQLFRTSELDRLIVLLKLLSILSRSTDLQSLALAGIHLEHDDADSKKLADVYQFTMREFHRKIHLDEVAAIASMTANSFCRYFKKRTRKSYVDFLTEIRIGHACQLLQQKDLSISQVCFEVGFNNLSNFNRKFRELCTLTPTEFKKHQVRSGQHDHRFEMKRQVAL
jgi:AraC-like DNA-binding protein